MFFEKKLKERFMKKINAIDSFEMGGLVSGFKQHVLLPQVAECYVTDSDFIMMNDEKKEYGRISRDSVSSVCIEDHTNLAERLANKGVLTMGAFSLAAQTHERVDDFYLSVNWHNENTDEEAIFNFTGKIGNESAVNAESMLNKYIINNS